MNQPEFGKKVVERRKELGFTQEEVAEKCKITVRTIQRIEAGLVNPRMYTIKMLTDFLDFEKGVYYKEKVENLREFYEHLAIYVIVNFFIYLTDILNPSKDFELHKISILWGVFLLFHAAAVFFEIFFGADWEEKKIKQLINKTNLFRTIRNAVLSKRALTKFSSKLVTISVIAILLAWYLFVGYHNHQVTIYKGDISVNIKSGDSKFEFSPSQKRAKEMNEYAINEYRMSSELGKPFKINGHGIIRSKQTINLPDSVSEYRFAVNNHDFILKGNNLYHGKNNWYLLPNEPLIINADKIN